MKNIPVVVLLVTLISSASWVMAADKVVVIPLGGLQGCPESTADCSGQCVDTLNNPSYCGDCFTQCTVDEYCYNGNCLSKNTPDCGDGSVYATEICGGIDVGAETCITLGYTGGELVCNETCNGFDTSNCTGVPMEYPLQSGDLVITEVMTNPTTLSGASGQWFEVYNPTDQDFNLNGCTIYDGFSDSHVITGGFIVPSHGYATAAISANPGFTPGYVYGFDIMLASTGDEIYIKCGRMEIDGIVVEIDGVEYDNGTMWPNTSGMSMNLSPASLDSASNDHFANWCYASQSYNGDLGTPNNANTDCP